MFDYRPSQSPELLYKRLIVTDALEILGEYITHFIITIDPILPGNDNSISVTYANIIRFEKIGMIIK
jgi:hypothetical protein